MTQREAFEAWALRNTSLPSAHDMAWAAWQAAIEQPQAEPYGHVTTHAVTGRQFFYRHPEPPYLDTAKECIAVFATPQQAQPTPAAPAVPRPDEFLCPYCFDQGAAPAVQPLTDAEITNMFDSAGIQVDDIDFLYLVIGMVERHHGIEAPGSKP